MALPQQGTSRRAFRRMPDARAGLWHGAPAADPKVHLALLAGMVGALAISRAVNERQMSEAVLQDTRNFWIERIQER